MRQPHVRYLGEIGETEKAALLGGAQALLFPIDWPEPFGMVVIEALSCGTPVLAWPGGSVPELIEPGVNGWIVDSIDEAVDALRRVAAIDRAACRASFDRRFTAERMARDYVSVYKRLRDAWRGSARGAHCMKAVADAPDAYYIVAESGPDPETRALKDGETFGVFDVFGDISGRGAGAGQGLYHDGTRHLSLCQLRLTGHRPFLLGSSTGAGGHVLTVHLTNPDLPGDHELLWPRSVHARAADVVPVGPHVVQPHRRRQPRPDARCRCRSICRSTPTSATCSRCAARIAPRAAACCRRARPPTAWCSSTAGSTASRATRWCRSSRRRSWRRHSAAWS